MAPENGGNNANTSSVKRVLRDSFRTAPPWRIYRDNGRVVFWSYRGHVPAFAIELRSPLPPIASRPLDIHKSNYSAATFSRLGAEIVLFRDLIEGTESRTREGIVIYYLFKALSLSLSHRSNDDDRSQIAVTAIVAFPSSAIIFRLAVRNGWLFKVDRIALHYDAKMSAVKRFQRNNHLSSYVVNSFFFLPSEASPSIPIAFPAMGSNRARAREKFVSMILLWEDL